MIANSMCTRQCVTANGEFCTCVCVQGIKSIYIYISSISCISFMYKDPVLDDKMFTSL